MYLPRATPKGINQWKYVFQFTPTTSSSGMASIIKFPQRYPTIMAEMKRLDENGGWNKEHICFNNIRDKMYSWQKKATSNLIYLLYYNILYQLIVKNPKYKG